jgi:predicted GTPase
VEEREEYEAPVALGMVMFAGVDYEAILRAAEQEADVIVWDGGNNDFPFVRPDLMVTVVDPLRPGHETAYHPGETNLRMADVVVVNKVDAAEPAEVQRVLAAVAEIAPDAAVVRAESPVVLDGEGSLEGMRALVVEDGPTLTHGGMPFGAGTVAARAAGVAQIVDPRPYAVGSIQHTYRTYPSTGPVLPAMGYGAAQLADLAATIRAAPVDVVVVGTPMNLARLVDLGHPVRQATYSLREVGSPTLAEVLAPYVDRWTEAARNEGPPTSR